MKGLWIVGALCTICLVEFVTGAERCSVHDEAICGRNGRQRRLCDRRRDQYNHKTLNVGKQPHGIAATTDGRWVWIATEGDGKIHRIDAVHDLVTDNFDLGPYQQEMEITNDGRMLYTGRFMDGCYDVFDTIKKKVVAHLPVDGSPHNVVKAAKDDRFMYLAPMNLSPTGGDSDVAAKFAIARGILRDCDGKPKIGLCHERQDLCSRHAGNKDCRNNSCRQCASSNCGERRRQTTLRGRRWPPWISRD